MRKNRHLSLILIIFSAGLLLSGCSLITSSSDSEATVHEIITSEGPAETSELLFEDEDEEVTTEVAVPTGRQDRLPGSLKWDSVDLYAAGLDFFRNPEAELKTDLPEQEITPPGQSSATTDSASDLPAPGDVLITTVDDTTDWGVPIDDEDEDGDWYNLP